MNKNEQLSKQLKFGVDSTVNRNLLANARKSTMYADKIISFIYEETKKGKIVNHQALSDELGISKSNLSNAIDRLDRCEVLYTEQLGNKKYYFLTGVGVEVYECLINAPLIMGIDLALERGKKANINNDEHYSLKQTRTANNVVMAGAIMKKTSALLIKKPKSRLMAKKDKGAKPKAPKKPVAAY